MLANARSLALLAYSPLALVLADARSPAFLASAPLAMVLADARSLVFLACVPLALVLADARSLALLACAPPALVLADPRSLALLACIPLALVLAHAYRSLMLFLALVGLLPHGSLTKMRLHASRFRMTRLHRATRKGRQRRLQLLPRSMRRVTIAAHVLGNRLLLALSLHRCVNILWPCSLPRRYSTLILCTLPLEYLHRDQGLEISVQRLARSMSPDTVSLIAGW